jgi:hypothetical protein
LSEIMWSEAAYFEPENGPEEFWTTLRLNESGFSWPKCARSPENRARQCTLQLGSGLAGWFWCEAGWFWLGADSMGRGTIGGGEEQCVFLVSCKFFFAALFHTQLVNWKPPSHRYSLTVVSRRGFHSLVGVQ